MIFVIPAFAGMTGLERWIYRSRFLLGFGWTPLERRAFAKSPTE